ncbi:hypothetical protein PMI41_00858 [Phyllobacterium sp. YR531]|nr:hypothetical protein PMI41_00858 [Phyllobacterium sp. YR531]
MRKVVTGHVVARWQITSFLRYTHLPHGEPRRTTHYCFADTFTNGGKPKEFILRHPHQTAFQFSIHLS